MLVWFVSRRDVHGGYVEMKSEVELGKLVVQEKLGEGAFAVVFRVMWKGQVAAAKVLKEDDAKQAAEMSKEAGLLTSLSCPFIVNVFEMTTIKGKPAMVMELVPHGSLEDVMGKGPFSTEVKLRMAKDIASGMAYLHSQQIIHRDLKLANVLVVSTDPAASVVCKVSDFGTARSMDAVGTMSMTMTANIGTPLYMAPELLNGSGRYSVLADVYSFGILLAGLWNQAVPYAEQGFKTMMEFINAVVRDGLRPSVRTDCPAAWVQMMKTCWGTDPHSRPTFAQIVEAFQ